jgi:predicted NBD/HSP70 family sugar kinase
VITGLTAAAIANITQRLLRNRLILEAGATRGARGQPATRLVINPDCCYSMGLNIDRDHITLVVVDFTGRVRARASRESKFALPRTVQNFFRQSAEGLLTKAGIKPARLVGLGIALPDDIQRPALPEQPPEYAMWSSVAVDRLLAGALPMLAAAPIFVENDAAAAAMGEMQFGLGQRYQSFFYVLLTAALGGGLVVEGHYFRGATGRSGEIGLLLWRDATGKACELQGVVSLSALYGRLAAQGFRVASPRGLLQLDEPARGIVDGWIDTAVDALENALVAINCLLNPEAILIGGRLPGALVDRLAARLNERMRARESMLPSIAPIARAALAEDAPAVGAAILPFSDRFLPTRFALMNTTGDL